ncbi:Rieske (2Fe-2S) protein [Mumia sp. Pv 4-285]|uniref:Rieske (2Fe-2S) protein n=1 Tax=Mumia qirimensis TaxID=3234852 RepID=UPI00351CE0DB
MTDIRSTVSPMKRRTLIQGAGAVGGTVVAGGLLAACGSDDEPSSSDTSAPPASETTAPEGDPTTEGGAAPTGTELGPTSDVPVGSGHYFESEKVIVTQPTEGTFEGFSSVCTHQGCAVSMIEDDVMICPCHGSEFSAKDGSVVQGPAEQSLKAREVRVDGDTIFLV